MNTLADESNIRFPRLRNTPFVFSPPHWVKGDSIYKLEFLDLLDRTHFSKSLPDGWTSACIEDQYLMVHAPYKELIQYISEGTIQVNIV